MIQGDEPWLGSHVSGRFVVVEIYAAQVAVAVQEAQHDGFCSGELEIDRVAAKHGQAQIGGQPVAVGAAVANVGKLMQLIVDAVGKAERNVDAASLDEVGKHVIDVGTGCLGDDERFGANGWRAVRHIAEYASARRGGEQDAAPEVSRVRDAGP